MKTDAESEIIVKLFGGAENFKAFFNKSSISVVDVPTVVKYIDRKQSYADLDAGKNWAETKVGKKMSRSTFTRRNRKVAKGLPRN